MRPTGNRLNLFFVVAGLFLFPAIALSQDKILEKSIRLGTDSNKTSRILEEISLATGYYFTYDTRVIDKEKRITLAQKESTVRELLDSVAVSQSLKYSIIGRHIILYRDDIVVTPPDSVTAEKPKDIILSGKVADIQSGEPLSFATIGIHRKGRGTITNNDGEFILKIPADCIEDTVSVSYVGYSNRYLPVRSLRQSNMVISMEQSFISIPEIIIRAQDPVTIIRKAIWRIADNYGTKPAILTGFYREGIFRKQQPQIYSEAVIKVYKSAYARSFQNDQIKVLQSRKIENLDMKDTLSFRLRAGLNTCMILDGVKETFDFTDPESMSNYNYHLRDMVSIDGERAYVIAFEQKPGIKEPLFKGDIYINSVDYGIMMAEFEIAPELIHLTRESYISRLPSGYMVKPVSVSYSVRYRKVNDRYFLSHVRGDLEFAAKGRRSLFNSHFNVFLEVAYTDYQTDNVERFARDEIIPPYSVFTKTINSYDSEFWKEFNFLKPEEEITDRMEELKARLKISEENGN